MLKRFFLALITVFLMLTSNSCSSNKMITIRCNMDNVNLIEINKEDLKEKITNKEDFLLIIQLEGCSSCETFNNNVLKPFISKTHATIYGINSYEVDAINGFENSPKYKLAPNIQIYKEGKSIKSFDYDDSKSYFTNHEEFENFIAKYVRLSNIIDVSEAYLDQAIIDKQSFVLYIGWDKCGDCTLVKENVLDEYLSKNKSDMPIYYLEVDEYRRNKPSSCPDISNATPEDLLFYEYYMKWLNFAKKYNFDSYEDGKVPTFQYYENGVLKDMIVYKNDIIVDEIIVKSFYEELVNKKMETKELNDFHKNKVIEFLNKYYK